MDDFTPDGDIIVMAPDRTAQTDNPTTYLTSLLRVSPDSAIRHLPAHAWLWIVTAVVLTVDLWTKAWAVRTLPLVHPDPPTYLFGLITLRRSFNPGALFGLGEGLFHVFILASLLALIFVFYLFACSSRRQRILHFALALILAGALGNLYDRAKCRAHVVTFKPDAPVDLKSGIVEVIGGADADPVLIRPWGTDAEAFPTPRSQIASIETQGIVRDFIRFEPTLFGRPIWPWIFNVADMALTVGVAVLLIHFWVDRKRAAGARAISGTTEDAPA